MAGPPAHAAEFCALQMPFNFCHAASVWCEQAASWG